MKNAVWFLAILITISGVLLERGDACNANLTWSPVGEMTVSDPSCAPQCRQEQVQIAWDTSNNTFDWEYSPLTCVACPAADSAAASCQQ